MIADLFPNASSAKFYQGNGFHKRIFHWWILFLFPPLICHFKGPIISPIFYTIPWKVILLFLELFEEKNKTVVLFLSDLEKRVFPQLLVRRLRVCQQLMISTVCFSVLVCGDIVCRPAHSSHSHCRAWQNPGKLYLWEKQLGVKAVLLIRFSLVHSWCW